MAATNASAEAEAEARSILERAAESSFPPLHAVHHLLSVGVRLLLPAHVLAALLGVRCLISKDSVSPPREPVRFAELFLCLILYCYMNTGFFASTLLAYKSILVLYI